MIYTVSTQLSSVTVYIRGRKERVRGLQVVSQAMKIVTKELRSDRLQLLWSLIFMIYLGVIMSMMVERIAAERSVINPFADFMLIFFSPMLGLSFSRRSFRYLNEDSYTQMLYYYRFIPVPAAAVVLSRAIFGILAFAVNSTVFFGVMYLISGNLRELVSIQAYISFSLTWLGIGILLHGVFIYLELLKNGKSYFWINILLQVTLVVTLFILFYAGLRFSWARLFLDISQEHGLLSPLAWGALITGLAGYAGMSQLTYKRMLRRDLT